MRPKLSADFELQGGPLSLNLFFIYARQIVTMAFLGAAHAAAATSRTPPA